MAKMKQPKINYTYIYWNYVYKYIIKNDCEYTVINCEKTVKNARLLKKEKDYWENEENKELLNSS